MIIQNLTEINKILKKAIKKNIVNNLNYILKLKNLLK